MMGSSIIYILFLIAIILTYCVVKRFRSESGIFIYLITFATVPTITLAGGLLPIAVFSYIEDLYQSETYNAKIVDFVYEKREKTDEYGYTREVPVKVPVFQLITTQGDTITKQASHYYSSHTYNSKSIIYKVNYNPHTGNIFIADRGFYTILSVIFFLAMLFEFILVGTVLYILNKDMIPYKQILGIAFFCIVIPMIILGFAIVLLLAAYEEDDLPLPAKIACIIFGVLLLLVFMGYVKNFISKSKKSHRGNRRSRPPFLVFRR